eukprot:351440-Chlamydomonas_euryale.AAC.3
MKRPASSTRTHARQQYCPVLPPPRPPPTLPISWASGASLSVTGGATRSVLGSGAAGCARRAPRRPRSCAAA